MRYQHVLVRGAVAALAIVAVVACGGDGSVAPNASTPRAARADLSPTAAESKITRFTVQPGHSTTQMISGGHKLVIPADAICDLESSGYGARTWENPCRPSAVPVTITAISSIDSAGHPSVDFTPALRFTPDDAKAVTLYMLDKATAQDMSLRIYYCKSVRRCIDESIDDPEVATKTDLNSGFIYRRVKHFSGYNIVSGYGGGAASME